MIVSKQQNEPEMIWIGEIGQQSDILQWSEWTARIPQLLVYVPVDERSNLESIGEIVLGPPSTNNDHIAREDDAFEAPFGLILIALNESDALPAGYFLDRGHSVHVTCAIEKARTIHPTT